MSLTINVHQLTSSPVKMAGFESHTNSNAEAQNRHRYRHHNIQNTLRSEDENNINEEDDDDGIVDEDGSSSMSSSPSIPDENINFDLVYALHTFTATVEGQASVVKGDALVLMEDVNIYWWLVEVLKTREIGYIPAENIEVRALSAFENIYKRGSSNFLAVRFSFTLFPSPRHLTNDWLD